MDPLINFIKESTMTGGLEISGNGNNGNNGNENTSNDRSQSQSQKRRDRRNEDRKDRATATYKSLTDVLRPSLGGKNLTPRADLILKWLKLSHAENKEILPDYDIRLGTISREQGYEVRYPGIILTVNKKGTNRIASHVLLISDGEIIEPKRRRSFNSIDITEIIVPSRTWNENYEKQVKAEILEIFSDLNTAESEIKFASMGCSIIPATFSIPALGDNPSNDNNPLDPVFVQAVESLTSFDRFIRRDTSRVELGKLFDRSRQVMSANVDLVPSVEIDPLGQPIRSDFCISLGIKKRDVKDEDEDSKNKDYDYNKVDVDDAGTILRVTGFVTPFYTTPDLDQRRPRNFGLNVVVTNISGDSTPSPELFLYGLAQTSILFSQDLWVDGYKPSILSATPNRNPGGLFLEIPDANGDSMRRKEYSASAQAELLDDLDFLFSEEVKISLDCNDSGALNWITDMFVWNETNNIFEAANNLTDREFDDIREDDYSIVVRDETRRFYLGYAETERGIHDIREVDYLYLMNCFDENTSLEAAKEWDYSIADDNEYGLHQRKVLIEDVYGHGQFSITGFTDRVVVEPQLIRDLVTALDEIDMLPSFDNYSKNHRPKQRLSANNVRGSITGDKLGNAYGGRTSRQSTRSGYSYRDRD